MEQRFTGRANRWSGVASTALKMAGLGGVEQWRPGGGCVMMNLRLGGGVVWCHGGIDG